MSTHHKYSCDYLLFLKALLLYFFCSVDKKSVRRQKVSWLAWTKSIFYAAISTESCDIHHIHF